MNTGTVVLVVVVAVVVLLRMRRNAAALVVLAVGFVIVGRNQLPGGLPAVPRLTAGSAGSVVSAPLPAGAPVPAAYRPWINRAGSQCADVTPAVLAAQLSQESGFSPRASSPAGAQGIAQFMPGTWRTWATDADGDGASVWDPADAITAQGRFMCSLAAAARQGVASGRLHGSPIALALAGYNCGFGCVQAAGGVPAIAETSAYVSRITALTSTYSRAVNA